MNNEHMEKIAEYYRTLNTYEKNEEYSQKHQTVYTASRSDRWLVFENKGKDTLQARLTDVHGRIQIWEDYIIEDGLIRLKKAACIDRDGTHTVEFSPEQIMFILRFGDYDRETAESIISGIADWLDTAHEEALALDIAEKLKRVPDVAYSNMFIIAQKRDSNTDKVCLTDRLKDLEYRAKMLNIPLHKNTCPIKVKEKDR